MKPIYNILTFLFIAWAGIACSDDTYPIQADESIFVPLPPDYTQQTMWYVEKNDSDGLGADIFYIPSTWEYDWYTDDGRLSHHADPSRADHRDDMRTEMTGIAEYMAPGNNFYSPFYRHITLDSWATLNEDTINRRYHDVSFLDVKESFNRFLQSENNGRPFILAGFSQGGKSVVELLKILDDDTRKRMVAAYVMGYKVSPDDVNACPLIRAARDSVDTGVVICYNSVSDVRYVKPVVSEPNVMCINPVNWRTDETTAILDDTIKVTLNERAKVLVVEGYDGSALPNILDILNTGDYHGAEPWLYKESLRRNIPLRIRAFRQSL
ncbi:MAG: DUF3089 domain-containing protein [Muribaculaceae bacterium]|nr:DUF3089 domain-containing protein [Muribaculaceae bacterium]